MPRKRGNGQKPKAKKMASIEPRNERFVSRMLKVAELDGCLDLLRTGQADRWILDAWPNVSPDKLQNETRTHFYRHRFCCIWRAQLAIAIIYDTSFILPDGGPAASPTAFFTKAKGMCDRLVEVSDGIAEALALEDSAPRADVQRFYDLVNEINWHSATVFGTVLNKAVVEKVTGEFRQIVEARLGKAKAEQKRNPVKDARASRASDRKARLERIKARRKRK